MTITLNGTTGITSTVITETSDGNVGIGTTSPNDNLDVASATPTLRLTDTDGFYSQIYGGSGSLVFRTDVGQATTGDTMQFVLSGSERMRIDSAGRVTMPYQPAFAAMRALQPDINTSQTVVFNSAFVNVGNHYNTSNGKFTAPINGLYEFQIFFLHRYRSGNGYVSVYPLKNGALFLPGNNRIAYSQVNQVQEQTCGGVFYASLAAGDTMEIRLEFNSTVTDMYGGDINSFCGKLIG